MAPHGNSRAGKGAGITRPRPLYETKSARDMDGKTNSSQGITQSAQDQAQQEQQQEDSHPFILNETVSTENAPVAYLYSFSVIDEDYSPAQETIADRMEETA